MEKRISVFIGLMIFSLVKIYRISILIGYTVFLTSEENRIVILLTRWPPCWRRSERVFGFYAKFFSAKFFIIETHTKLALKFA